MVSKSRESEGGKGSDSGRTGDETSEARAGIKPQAATEPRRACFSLQWSRRLLTPGRAWRAPWPLLNGLFVVVDGLHYYCYPLLVLLVVPLRTYHSIRIIVLGSGCICCYRSFNYHSRMKTGSSSGTALHPMVRAQDHGKTPEWVPVVVVS